MSLYQKFRPASFADMTGQTHVSKTLQNAIKLDLISHAYLFCGPRGTGKTTSARILSKALNCLEFDNEKLEPCNKCSACSGINSNSILDVIEIDAASNRGIDEIRLLKENVGFAPTQVKNKVYIIDEVHMLTNEAFNALLKTLEEPPENVYFILATTEAHKIPETIVSRCQKFNFERLSVKDIVSRLEFICGQEKIEFDVDGLTQIAEVSRGGMRDSISLLDQVQVGNKVTIEAVRATLGKSDAQTVNKMLSFILEKNHTQTLNLIDDVYQSGNCLVEFSQDLLDALREHMHQMLESNPDQAVLASEIIALFYDLKQKFNDSGLIKQTLEVFVIQAIGVLSGVGFVDVGAPQAPKTNAAAQSAPATAAGVAPAAPAPADPALRKDIDTLKDQIRNLQTILDTQTNLINQQAKQIREQNDKISSLGKPSPLDKMTPMLDSALKMLEQETKENEDSKPIKIYADSFELDEVTKVFSNCQKHIKSSALKRALNQAKLEKVDEQTIGLVFTSQFLISTVDKAEFIDELEQALAKEYKLLKFKPMLGATNEPRAHAGGIPKAKNHDPFALDPAEEALRKKAQSSAEDNAPEQDSGPVMEYHGPDLDSQEDLADFFEGEIM